MSNLKPTSPCSDTRQLLVFAPTSETPVYNMQLELLTAAEHGLTERDLSVTTVVGDARADLRQRYEVPRETFVVVLIGKDGTEKARYLGPVKPDELFKLIDPDADAPSGDEAGVVERSPSLQKAKKSTPREACSKNIEIIQFARTVISIICNAS